jgi:2-aminoadipate transaminase
MDDRIDRLQRLSSRKEGLLCLAGGLPADELFPKRLLADAFVFAVSLPGCAALQYGWPEGSEGLRTWIARRLAERGARVSSEDVIVTSGAQQALAIAAELIDVRGARIGVDPESYPGALDLFRARGAVTVANDEGASASYVVVGASNPRGLGVSPARRAALVASGRLLVVDEAYAELRFDGRVERPVVADARDRVLHVGTLSKTLCPGLRVGWLVPPPQLRAEALRIKHDIDLQAGSLAQAVLERYLATGDYDARLVRARRTYASRASRLVRALRRELPSLRFVEPEGGFAIFAESDEEDVDEARALAIATSHGVSFDPGSMFRADGSSAPFGMRLSCSQLSGEAIDEAVRRLARAFREIVGARDHRRRPASPRSDP